VNIVAIAQRLADPRVLCALVLSMLFRNAPAAAQEILVPFYSYPAHFDAAVYDWDDLAAVAAAGRVTAVINPADGPDPLGPNADYRVGLAALGAARVPLLGYVSTRLPGVPLRPLADVRAEIDVWATAYAGYGFQGVFLDGTSTAEADVPYFESLYAYIHGKPGFVRVVSNPGAPPARAYYERPTADTIVAFEGSELEFSAHTPASYMTAYSPGRSCALVYGVPGASGMRNALALALRRGYGAVFITDGALPNPWDHLPPYFAEQARGAVPVPALPQSLRWLTGLGLLVLGAGGATWRRRSHVRGIGRARGTRAAQRGGSR
jgi:Spherulation-specific family 4